MRAKQTMPASFFVHRYYLENKIDSLKINYSKKTFTKNTYLYILIYVKICKIKLASIYL